MMEYCSVQITEESYEASKIIVETVMKKANFNLTEKELELLTKDIMETSMMMGGDFQASSIESICNDYIESNFYPRFLQAHSNELGNPFFRF